MKSISVTQLVYVVELAKAGHFAKAAKQCFVTQPTLSMQIQKLEEELGVVLFDRKRKPIEPTPIGYKVVAIAKNILNEMARIEAVIQGERHELEGELRLGIIPTLSPYLLPRFLKPFLTAHPKVELTVEELQTEEILKRINEGRLDVGLVALPLRAKGIVEKPLFREPFVVYLPEGHPLRKFGSLTESQLTDKDLWILNEGHCFREQVISLCKFKNRHGEGQRIHFESGSLETLKRLVDQNQGYTLLPYLAVTEGSMKKKVKSFKEPAPAREIGLVHSDSFLKLAMLEALTDEIVGSLPQELKPGGAKTKKILFAL